MNKRVAIAIFVLVFGVLLFFFYNKNQKSSLVESELPGFLTNTSKKSIDLKKILSGGPGKDGIPAIDDPKFISINKSGVEDDVMGILIEVDGQRRFYPYTILVWHEIVNDKINGKDLAITFCPLCGSAIVFDRLVNGEILRFGVSGYLFESNLLMFDDKTESLWSQSRGEAVVGDYTGTKLQRHPVQVISFSELKNKYPNALVLSSDTGHLRNYGVNPYGDYDTNDELIFPVTVDDKKFPLKEIMYVVPLGEKSLAFPQLSLKKGMKVERKVNGQSLTIERKGEEIFVRSSGEILPGYFEMWFSWATQHQEDGIVIEIN